MLKIVSELYFKDLKYRDAFLLITVIIIVIIIIIVVNLYLTSAKTHVNDKTVSKSHSLQLRLFTPN